MKKLMFVASLGLLVGVSACNRSGCCDAAAVEQEVVDTALKICEAMRDKDAKVTAQYGLQVSEADMQAFFDGIKESHPTLTFSEFQVAQLFQVNFIAEETINGEVVRKPSRMILVKKDGRLFSPELDQVLAIRRQQEAEKLQQAPAPAVEAEETPAGQADEVKPGES